MAENPRELRRFPRVPTQKVVLVKRIGDDASETLAKTRTVGGGGCMFVHHEPLGVGTAVELLISLPSRVVRAQGRVVWEAVVRAGTVEVGVEFLDVSAKDRHALEVALADATVAVP